MRGNQRRPDSVGASLTFHRQRLREAKSEALKAKAKGHTDTAREWLMESYGHQKAVYMLENSAKAR